MYRARESDCMDNYIDNPACAASIETLSDVIKWSGGLSNCKINCGLFV